jgi:hypothetical protein
MHVRRDVHARVPVREGEGAVQRPLQVRPRQMQAAHGRVSRSIVSFAALNGRVRVTVGRATSVEY